MSWAALFPGQGAFDPAALPWLDDEPACAALLEAMDRQLGGGGWRARAADAAWRSTNAVAQLLVTGTSVAAWLVLRSVLPPPAIVAGYSVGELAACAAAGLYDAEAALVLATRRACCMDAAAAGQVQGMLSVRGLALDELVAAGAALGLQPAIVIAPRHALLAGPAQAIEQAAAQLTLAGGEVRVLEVRIASHTTAMADAVDCFAAVLAATPLRTPACRVATCIDGRDSRDVGVLRAALARQLAHTVHWDRCMDTIAERGVRRVLEVGAGRSLAGLWAQAQPAIAVRSIAEFAHWRDAVRWLGDDRPG